MYGWSALIIILCGTLWSLWVRADRFRHSAEQTDTKASPFSIALQELVATAGGVYLSFIMLVAFLKLEIPDKILLFQVAFDPLALTALGIAIIQPLFIKFIDKK
ncbi:Hypothetical protein LUCI_3302 [Lucifera butyrica]|uniref:Uncharacterized protein n=1 Tax=Lucifera butyrica TaxID=1351585 RepID=A0A498RAZ2_9FIRM|nr:hypothetical protein [Lucifera butyrica]VBB08037.1 Hypothetical protein LUCI_3302 [Lucifera butyrica]